MDKSRVYCYWTIAVIAAITLAHVLLSQHIGFGVDEAHYALYGLKPDLSYFDHPPLMGWLIALLNVFADIDVFNLRLLTTAMMAVNSWLLYCLARQVSPNIAYSGLVAVALFNLGIMVQLLWWGIVPDVPLMTCLLCLALLISRLNRQPHIGVWLALGLLMGLSALSKYTAIVAPIALSIFTFQRGYILDWLKQPGLWLAIAIAALVISPILIWNAEHDWASFTYQINHGSEGEWRISHLLKTLASHLLLFSPLLVVAGIVGLFSSSSDNPTEQFVRWLFLCYICMVAWAAGNGELLPHWGVVAYLFLSPIAAKHIDLFWQHRWKKILGIFLAGMSAILFLALYVLVALRPVSYDIHKAYYDILGWEQAGEEVKTLVKQHDIEQVLVDNWTHASRIAWYSQFEPVRVLDEKPNQYDIWYRKPLNNKRSLLVLPSQINGSFSQPNYLATSSCKQVKETPFVFKGKTIISFRYYLCNRALTAPSG